VPLDHVNRQSKAARPNAPCLSDFTYVAIGAGFVYVAFVFMHTLRGSLAGARHERRMPASCSTRWSRLCMTGDSSIAADSCITATEAAQYVSIKYSERPTEAGVEPSVGSVGDSYDNALAETINGLYKAEVIHRRGLWRSFEAVEFCDLAMGRLVQQAPAAGADRQHPAGRPRPRSTTPPQRTNKRWRRDSISSGM
jgi:putative transposase